MIRRTGVDALKRRDLLPQPSPAVPVETIEAAPATGVALYDGTWKPVAIGAEKQHDGRRWHRRSCGSAPKDDEWLIWEELQRVAHPVRDLHLLATSGPFSGKLDGSREATAFRG